MARFFRKETNKSFTYPAIVERKAGPNFALWIVGAAIIAGISIMIYLLIN